MITYHSVSRPSAFVIALMCTWATHVSAQSPEAVAQLRYAQGVEHFQNESFDAAAEEFRASLSSYDSPNSRLMLGRTLHEMNRNAEAWLELCLAAEHATTIADSTPRYERTARDARALAAELEPSLSWLTLSVTPFADGVEVTVAGRRVGAAALDTAVPVDSGEVSIRVRAVGYEEYARTYSLESGERRSVSIELGPTPTAEELTREYDGELGEVASSPRERSGARVAAGASGALALIAAVSFATTGAMAQRIHSDLSASCDRGDCEEPQIIRGERLTVATNAMIAFAGAAALSTLVSWIVARRHARKSSDVAEWVPGIRF